MSYSRRFGWGEPYLLTDIKDGVFIREPAVFIGKKDADRERPTMCAVCGEPLGSTDYCSFFLLGPDGRGIDMMIGNGCIRERIREEEIGTREANPRATLFKMVNRFPTSGRWYGTFLHHCIAKPYARKKEVAERWDESILKLPGVRYIMDMIDGLRGDGWKLDAEMFLECGNVDLLATHPDGRAVVFDWKSDRSFDSHDAYIEQVNRYMAELYGAGMRNIAGYIVWVMDRRLEPVRFTGAPMDPFVDTNRSYAPSLPIKCSLTIEMNGGEGPRKKRFTEYSHHRPYGDEVSFFIPPFEPYLRGYEFKYFNASPYRDGERLQPFDKTDVAEGFHVSFICSKKRHVFKMDAHWKKIRPFECSLFGQSENSGPDSALWVHCMSETGEDGIDYAEFDVSSINKKLHGKILSYVTLAHCEFPTGTKTEWTEDELCEGMKIRIPCIDDRAAFHMVFETKVLPRSEEGSNVSQAESGCEHRIQPQDSIIATTMINAASSYQHPYVPVEEADIAEHRFTPGRIYESGGRYYGVYRRMDSERHNTSAKVDVAEVDIGGRKISNLERRYVYLTQRGKEYIYALANREWKVYTRNVLVGLAPEGIERF